MTTRKSNSKNNNNVENTTHKLGEGMVLGARFDYEEFELIYQGEGLFTCIGHFPLNIREKVLNYAEEKPVLKSNVRDSHVNTLSGDDFGPQRFCNVCNVKLIEVYESMDNQAMFIHPNTPCSHDAGVLLQPEDMNAGIANHKDMTMDDLREVYRSLKGKDAEWLHIYSDELKKLYKYSADRYSPEGDAMSSALPFATSEDDDGESSEIEFSDESTVDLTDGTLIRTNKFTKLTKEEQWLRGYASYVLAYNPGKVVEKAVNSKNVRPEIKEDIIHLANCFLSAKLVHPKLERRRRNYPKNWRELQPVLERAERIERETAAFLHQDWELESRMHECNLVHCCE